MKREKWYILLSEDLICPICCYSNSIITQELKQQINEIMYSFIMKISIEEMVITDQSTIHKITFEEGNIEFILKSIDKSDLFDLNDMKKTHFLIEMNVHLNSCEENEYEPFMKDFSKLTRPLTLKGNSSKSVFFN